MKLLVSIFLAFTVKGLKIEHNSTPFDISDYGGASVHSESEIPQDNEIDQHEIDEVMGPGDNPETVLKALSEDAGLSPNVAHILSQYKLPHYG